MTFGNMSEYLDNLKEHSILVIVLALGVVLCSNSISTLMAVSLITFLMTKDFTTSLIVGGLLYVSMTNMQGSGQENFTFNEDSLLRFNVLSKDYDDEDEDEHHKDKHHKDDHHKRLAHKDEHHKRMAHKRMAHKDEHHKDEHHEDAELHKMSQDKLKSLLSKLDSIKHKTLGKKHVSDSDPIETPSIGQYACSKHNKNPTIHKYVLDNVHTRDIDSVEMYEGAESAEFLKVSQCLDDSARCLSE